jgi:hypothetical protein
VNSTSSEGVMTAGLFRQAARRSSTNLVEEAAEPIRSVIHFFYVHFSYAFCFFYDVLFTPDVDVCWTCST